MQRILNDLPLYANRKVTYSERMKIMMNLKKSNVITAIICAVTLSTVSFYTGVSAASSSSVSYKSQGKIVFDNNTDDTSDDVVFDASDFKTISDMVISGKKQIGTELNKYPSVNFNLSSSIPDFAELANAVDILTDDTTDTTSDKILKDYTAYVKGNKIKGSIPSKAAATYTPGRSDQTIAAGQYLGGAQTIKGDSNLQAANIVSGKTIFGVTGTATTESHRIESNKSVTISNTSGSITPTSGNNAMAAVSYSVQGVDASKIVSGQSILGVSGNHTCTTCTQTHRTPQSSKTVTPTADGFTVTPDSGYNSMDQVVINGDSNLIAENIKDGVEIFGVTGSLNSSSSTTIPGIGTYYLRASGTYVTNGGISSAITVDLSYAANLSVSIDKKNCGKMRLRILSGECPAASVESYDNTVIDESFSGNTLDVTLSDLSGIYTIVLSTSPTTGTGIFTGHLVVS